MSEVGITGADLAKRVFRGHGASLATYEVYCRTTTLLDCNGGLCDGTLLGMGGAQIWRLAAPHSTDLRQIFY